MYVKFIKGTQSQYTNKAATYASDGTIFFTTDDSVIYANGKAYGVSDTEKQSLKDAIDSINIVNGDDTSLVLRITYVDSTKEPTTIELPVATSTRNGLITPAQKKDLEDIKTEVITGGTGTIKDKVEKNQVGSSGQTILVTQDNSTNIEVNIDNETIVQDSQTKQLKVVSSALSQYVGDNRTISVSAVDSNNQKTISFIGSMVEVPAADLGDATVRTAYELRDSAGNAIGSRIVIPKDNSFMGGQMGKMGDTINAATGVITPYSGTDADKLKAALELKYINASGQYVLIQIDIEEYLKEAEFKDGLKVDNHEVSVKLSTNTESAKYLKIQAITGANGAIELSGIDAAIAAASSRIALKTTGHVTVSSTSDTNGTVYTISENDIASQQALTDEIARAKAAETAIDSAVGLVKGANDETRTYSNSGTYIGKQASNTVKSDIKALDDAISNLSTSIRNVTVNGVNATVSNNTATVEIDSDNIKVDKDGNAAEAINTGGSITRGTTVGAAIQALEAQLLWYQAD